MICNWHVLAESFIYGSNIWSKGVISFHFLVDITLLPIINYKLLVAVDCGIFDHQIRLVSGSVFGRIFFVHS